MNVDLLGRVRNTKLATANCLLPLFEAVVNGIHAIDERLLGGGNIDITIEREKRQGALRDPDAIVTEPITGFSVTDNGVGFTEKNYRAFQTCDSTNKAAQGGKGIGRLLWLKAFDRADIDSTFEEDGKVWRRHFTFRLCESGVEKHVLEQAPGSECRTTVKLVGLRKSYGDRCPRATDVIAKRLIEHCLEYFVLDAHPLIKMHDDATGEVLNLDEYFSSRVRQQTTQASFAIKDQGFRITHVMIAPAQDSQHRLHFCAHNRAVVGENLVNRISNLQAPLHEEGTGRSFVYAGYVSGNYLDETVNPERTNFDSREEDTLDFAGGIAWQQLLDGAVVQASEFLTPYTEPIRASKRERISTYVQERAPQYRHLLKHKADAVDTIAPNLTDDRLDVELYKIDQVYDAELRERYHTILSNNGSGPKDQSDYEREVEQFLEEWNEAGMSKLARHVAYRKATLGFLESRLQLKDDGKYPLESAVHKIIFPLKKTSDDVRADQMNLWILDEKLAYHHYLASDIPFDQMTGAVEINSKNRPDIAIFKAASAFVDAGPPFASIVLIEFKRPARDDYTDEDNPISQLYEYVRDIKAGNRKDHHGRPLTIVPQTPFYGYIVCDVTKRLQTQAENAQLTRTPDGNGYFGYNSNLGVYIEVISFDKLIGDAKKRNAVLFDKLGVLGD